MYHVVWSRKEGWPYLAKSMSLSIRLAAELKYSFAAPTTRSTETSYESLKSATRESSSTYTSVGSNTEEEQEGEEERER